MAGHSEQKEPVAAHLAAVGHQEDLVRERERIAIGPFGGLVPDVGKFTGDIGVALPARSLRPMAGGDEADRAVGPAMVRRQRGDHPIRAPREGPRLPKGGHIADGVAKKQLVAGAVGILGPEALAEGQVAVHVFPAGEKHPAVRQQLRAEVGQRIHAHAPDVRAVRGHAVQVGGRAGLAQGVAAPARRHEDQFPIRQRAGGDVIKWPVGELAQPLAIGADAVDVPPRLTRLAVGEKEGLRVGGEVEIVNAPLRIAEDRFHRLPGAGGIENVKAAARPAGPALPDIAADGVGGAERMPGQERDRRHRHRGQQRSAQARGRLERERLFPLPGIDPQVPVARLPLPRPQAHRPRDQRALGVAAVGDGPAIDDHLERIGGQADHHGKPLVRGHGAGDLLQGVEIVAVPAHQQVLLPWEKRHLVADERIRPLPRFPHLYNQPGIPLPPVAEEQFHPHLPGDEFRLLADQLRPGTARHPHLPGGYQPVAAVGSEMLDRLRQDRQRLLIESGTGGNRVLSGWNRIGRAQPSGHQE